MGFRIFQKLDILLFRYFESIVIAFIAIGLVSDLIKKFIYRYYFILPGHIGISSIPKGLFGLFLFYFFLRFAFTKKVLLFGLLWISVVFVGQYFYIKNVGLYNLSGNLAYLFKYLFSIIAFCALARFYSSNVGLKKIQKYFELLLKSNIIFIAIGFLFSIKWFTTYGLSRFGYSGFIEAQNEASLFMLIGLAYFFWKLSESNEGYFWFVAYLFANIILGTKIGILNSFVYSFVLLYRMRSRIGKVHLVIISLLGFALIPLLYFTLKGSFINILERSDIWTALSSNRNHLFFNHIETIRGEWGFQNLLFGGADFTRVLFEMDFLDLFYFCGLFGFVIFVYIYRITLFRNLNRNTAIFVFLFVIGGGLAGHYLASGVNAFCFAFFIHTTNYNHSKLLC